MAGFLDKRGAQAIADTLSGNNNPSGRLSISYPLNSQQLPVYYYQRDASKQESYYDQPGAPLYSLEQG
uniref:CAZy families GH3 protein n=1 Tax=uncultured Listeria sp. TaxID=592375 RepID=A0A060CSM9_9LIST|nr:CAZy families GH3 protein [uncultured Listeria sp.]